MTQPLTGISSMATRLLLAELADAYRQRTGRAVHFESVGGVDAARRVAAGEAFDVVALASDALAKLIASGHVVAGSQVDLVLSGVAVAVRDVAHLEQVLRHLKRTPSVIKAERQTHKGHGLA